MDIKKKYKIVVIDDELSMRDFFEIMLSKDGYDVSSFENGNDAIVFMKQNNVDLVITDLNMPKMDGISFIAEARKIASCKFVPIIVLTTESQMQKKDQAKKAGATGWIVKPFKPEQLITVIKKLCP